MQASGRVVRRVTKRTYDKYATEDYKVTSSNLNPVNPTELEGQMQHITEAIQGKIVDAYVRSQLEKKCSSEVLLLLRCLMLSITYFVK